MSFLKQILLIIAFVVAPMTMVNASPVSETQDESTETILPDELKEHHSFFLDVIRWYEKNINYATITFLMVLENTFVPIPSELVISPAAYIASRPDSHLNFFLIIVFGTLGALIGALIIYGLSAWLGRKALYKFADSRLGNFLMLDSNKVRNAEDFFNKRSKLSICIGRILPGVRLLISVPAGLAKMNLVSFILYTILGTGIYNTFLALLGYVLHGQDTLISRYSYQLSIATFVILGLMIVFFFVRYFILRFKNAKIYGLVGFPLGHSFSKRYFTERFAKEKINAKYELFQLEDLGDIMDIINRKKVSGLNVTIPYKEKVFDYITELDDMAANIGAVNVLKITHHKKQTTIKGYNTDAVGFQNSIQPSIKPYHKKALILGTGGASKAIDYVLKNIGLETTFVSRTEKEGAFTYDALNKELLADYLVIVNCTPLGTFPKIDECPDIPYQYITDKHLLFDAVYNPPLTLFLQKGKEQGAEVINGEHMLIGQAQAAWEIWNS